MGLAHSRRLTPKEAPIFLSVQAQSFAQAMSQVPAEFE
jgi:hypothetical protein